MILRSVTKHVKEQNWFAVVLDLVIVVFGVFIGIQVSNWNEELVQKEVTSILIQRLHDDVTNEHELIVNELGYFIVVKKYAIKALQGLRNTGSVNDEQFVIAAYQASQASGVWSFNSAYDELIRTGNINLIENVQLKKLIVGYYAADLADTNELASPIYLKYIRGIIPYEIQEMIKKECGDVIIPVASNFAFRLPETCDLQLPDELFRNVAANLRSLPDMLKNLQYQLSANSRYTTNLMSIDKESLKLISAIEKYQP
jgi:hypothetical protein